MVGLAAYVDGDTPQEPLTPYARVKAALEDECRLRAAGGMPVTSVRLGPVHGPGKPRSAGLVRLARAPVIPLPGGGRHSIGFVLLADAVRALLRVGGSSGPPVVSIGGGATPLGELLRQLARAQGRRPTLLPVPVPRAALHRLGHADLPDSVHWLLRLSLPREVAMQVPAFVTPLPEAAAMLVASC